MSGTTISNLPAAAGAITTDLVPVVEVGSPNVTKRLTIAQFLASVLPLAGGTLTGTLTVSVGGVVVSAGGLTVSAGGLTVSAGGSRATPISSAISVKSQPRSSGLSLFLTQEAAASLSNPL